MHYEEQPFINVEHVTAVLSFSDVYKWQRGDFETDREIVEQ